MVGGDTITCYYKSVLFEFAVAQIPVVIRKNIKGYGWSSVVGHMISRHEIVVGSIISTEISPSINTNKGRRGMEAWESNHKRFNV